MNFVKFQKSCLETWNSSDSSYDEQLFHAMLGIVGETGEFFEPEKKFRFSSKAYDCLKEKQEDELVDVLYYWMIVASLKDMNLEEALQRNIEKRTRRTKQGYYEIDSKD